MLDKHSRHIAELDGLAGQGEGTGNHCLRGDDGGQCREPDHRQERPIRCQEIERIAYRLRVAQDQRALAEVVQHQPWQHQHEPGARNRLAAEVAHIGIQGFGAGQREHHRTEDGHANSRVNDEKLHAPGGVERLQHFGSLQDAISTQCTENQKPKHHDRTEQDADPCSAVLLDQEQANQNHQGQRDDPVLYPVKRKLQPLYSRKHRNGRGDHAVAIEQRSTEQTEQDQ
ncbi:hypothetical protein D3C76_645600 [compost metagenome]